MNKTSVYLEADNLLQSVSMEQITGQGIEVLINGMPILGLVNDALSARVQTFLAENDWNKSAWWLQVDIEAFGDPWNIAIGSIITRPDHGWKAVVRKVDDEAPGMCRALIVSVT